MIQEVSRVGAQGVTSKSKLLAPETTAGLSWLRRLIHHHQKGDAGGYAGRRSWVSAAAGHTQARCCDARCADSARTAAGLAEKGNGTCKKGEPPLPATRLVIRVVAQAQQAARHDQERSVMRMRW